MQSVRAFATKNRLPPLARRLVEMGIWTVYDGGKEGQSKCDPLRKGMMTTESDPALGVLSTLKRQFEAGASQWHRLSHLLVNAIDGQTGRLYGRFPVEGCRDTSQALSMSSCSGDVSFRIKEDNDPENRVGTLFATRIHQIYMFFISGSYVSESDKRNYIDGRNQFNRLAERAGRCLLSLPADVIAIHPPEWAEYEQYLTLQRFRVERPGGGMPEQEKNSISRTYDAILPPGTDWAIRWVGFIHWLAWRNEAGAGLATKRKTWLGMTTIPWPSTRSEFDAFRACSGTVLLADFTFENTRHYFSELHDVFLSSALAIDAIDARCKRVRPKAVKPVKQDADAKMNPIKISSCIVRSKVFINYSHHDKVWLERLRVHLAPLERQGIVDRWDDTRIRTSQRWRDEIRKAIDSAKVAVLLVSADFLASEFIADKELPPLLEAAKNDGTYIMPVILRTCRFTATPALSVFQAVNHNSTVTDFS
jgi:hypothetical protein